MNAIKLASKVARPDAGSCQRPGLWGVLCPCDKLVLVALLGSSMLSVGSLPCFAEGMRGGPVFVVAEAPPGASISTSSQGFASNGDHYLAVWQVRTANLPNRMSVFAARVSRLGEGLDPAGLLVLRDASLQQPPAVAPCGRDFVVVWPEARGSSATGIDIYASRVTDAGVVLDPNGFLISQGPGDQTGPVVAGDTRGCFIAWTDLRNGTTTGADIFGTRLDPSGRVLDPDGLPISVAAGPKSASAVTTESDGYFVLWSANGARGVPVDSSGRVGNPIAFEMNWPVGDATFASSAQGFMAAWTSFPPDVELPRPSLTWVMFDKNGKINKADIGETPAIGEWDDSFDPAAASDGISYFLVSLFGNIYTGHPQGVSGVKLTYQGRAATGSSLESFGESLSTLQVTYRGEKQFLVGGLSSENGRSRILASLVQFGPVIRTLSKTAPGLALTWDSETDVKYRVQYTSELGGSPWRDVPGEFQAGGNTATAVDETAGEASQRYYRIIEVR